MNTHPLVNITVHNATQAAAPAAPNAEAQAPAGTGAPARVVPNRRAPVKDSEMLDIAIYVRKHEKYWAPRWWLSDKARWGDFWSTVSI